MRTTAKRDQKRIELMEKSFECYCENGLSETGIKALAKACDMTAPNFYSYFENLDELIIEATAHCMTKIELEFMSLAPRSADEIFEFIDKMPEYNAEHYGKQYRFMYQVYTTPKFLEHGKKFYQDTMQRYTEYSKELGPKLGIPWQVVQGMVILFAQATIQYALFEEKKYLEAQKITLKNMALVVREKYKDVIIPDEQKFDILNI